MENNASYKKRAIRLAKFGGVGYLLFGTFVSFLSFYIGANTEENLQTPWNVSHMISFIIILSVFFPITLRVYYLAKKAEVKWMKRIAFCIAVFMALNLLFVALIWLFSRTWG